MPSRIIIDNKYCKGCKLCIEVCPKSVYELSDLRNAKGYLMPAAAREKDCVGCLLCEMTCPDMAITVLVEDKGAQEK
jgi:2-oxoglutarate ferredoxin oxidoreductase subunit delta